jgi:hypothetical protein
MLLLIFSATVSLLVRPNHIKTWIQKSGTYGSLPAALLQEAAVKDETANTPNAIPFNDPGVQAAAKTALNSDFVRHSTEQIIDSSFKWLDGNTPQPDFSINIAGAKQTFADKLGDYLLKRYEGLPACAAGTAPTSTDPFKIDCKPAVDIGIERIIAEQKQTFLDNQDFLPKASVTPDSFKNEGSNQNFFEASKDLPKAYQALRHLPLIIGALALLTAVGVIFLAETKKAGVRTLGWRLTIIGGLSLFFTLLSAAGATNLEKLANHQGKDAAVTIYKDMFTRGLSAVQADLTKVGLLLSGVVLLAGIVLLYLTRRPKLDTRDNQTAPVEPDALSKIPSPAAPPKVPKPSTDVKTPLKPRPKPKRTLIQ